MTDTLVPDAPVGRILPPLDDKRDRTTKLYFDHETLLAEDIRLRGVRNPLRAMPEGDLLRLLCGETRRRAAVRLGLQTVPVIVMDRPLGRSEQLIEDFTDNQMREGYDALAQGAILSELRQINGWSLQELRRHVPAACKSAVCKAERVLRNLADDLKTLYQAGPMSWTAAYQLARIPDHDRQRKAWEVVREMSADAVPDYVNGLLNPTGAKKRRPKEVKGRTPKGLAYALPPGCDHATAKAELTALIEALTRAERQGLPLSTVPQLVRA